MSRKLVCLLVAACTIAAFMPSAEAAPSLVGRLRVGGHLFWDGPFTAGGDVSDSGLCGMTGPCWNWNVGVVERGHRLRVAIDVPARDDPFSIELFDPSGAVAASGTNENTFNAELFIDSPDAGMWRVHVRPAGATNTRFRLRAKLEGTPSKTAARVGELLPDLRSVPPYEFGFVAPANPFNGLYPDDSVNPPLDVAGVHPLSCAIDETVEQGTMKCLRFTAGPFNVGKGPFEIHFSYVEDTLAGDDRPAYQTIHRTDGKHYRRDAGTYSFHNTHGHFHYDNILSYELFRVVDKRRGRLRPVGRGFKSGFCPADQLIGEWGKFVQSASGAFGEGDSASGNCFSPTDGLIGLSSGWGDVYRWQRPGQLVDFGSQGDGYYVVRSTVDIENDVRESNDRNNASYALILVSGESIDIVERGLGRDPWDPAKRVVPAVGGPLR